MHVDERSHHFGTLPTGEEVRTVTLSNAGATAVIMSYGASLVDYRCAGVNHPLILGSPTLKPYLGPMRFFGAIVGRVANRIKGGVLSLEGRSYSLSRNENDEQTLHGGASGTSQRNWTFDIIAPDRCSLSCILEDGGDGFPGSINISVEYRIDENGALAVDLAAEAEATTVCNLAQHSYWCLDGAADLKGHALWIDADHYTPVDDKKLPTGEIAKVEGTEFDFRSRRPISTEFSIDHNYCLNPLYNAGPEAAPINVRRICELSTNEVALDVYSDQPGLQIYDAHAMNTAPHVGHDGLAYGAYAGLAIEPQKWPDAQHHAHFPSILLHRGERYQQHSVFHAYRR